MPRRSVMLAKIGPILAAMLLSGCGSDGAAPKYVVKGRITYKGEPMEVRPMVGRLRVSFVQQDVPPPVDPKYAAVKPDGSFEVRGDSAGSGSTHDTTTQYAYDARDNLRSVIDPDNLTTSYTYDGLDNLTTLASPDTGISSANGEISAVG